MLSKFCLEIIFSEENILSLKNPKITHSVEMCFVEILNS